MPGTKALEISIVCCCREIVERKGANYLGIILLDPPRAGYLTPTKHRSPAGGAAEHRSLRAFGHQVLSRPTHGGTSGTRGDSAKKHRQQTSTEHKDDKRSVCLGFLMESIGLAMQNDILPFYNTCVKRFSFHSAAIDPFI